MESTGCIFDEVELLRDMYGLVYLRLLTYTKCCVMSEPPPVWVDGYFGPISMLHVYVVTHGPIRDKSNDIVSGMSALTNQE